jgi:hypothetical protein
LKWVPFILVWRFLSQLKPRWMERERYPDTFASSLIGFIYLEH